MHQSPPTPLSGTVDENLPGDRRNPAWVIAIGGCLLFWAAIGLLILF